MASVFSAWDGDRRCDVAIKVLLPQFVATIVAQRFHREVEFLADLHHPNILEILDSGEANNLTYFTMPLAEGDTLRSRVSSEGRLPLPETISITEDVAGAIDHAHTHNIIHRDIKPDNVVFVDSRALICDFGIARALVSAGKKRLSSSGLIIGTPEYMSPEQASGEWELGSAADIYALGCLVFLMLAGEPPFTGSTAQAVMAKHTGAAVPSIRVVRPQIPENVEHAMQRALAKDPTERPATASELAAEMRAGS
jgi:serine/threonine-protein kinase